MRKIIIASVLALACAGGGFAQAQAPTGDSVAIRKAIMRLHSAALAGMNAAVQNKLDPKGFVNAAGALVASSAQLPGVFPLGSTANSRALPEIWNNAAGFAKAVADFGAAAEQARMVAAAGDVAAFGTAVKAISDTCTSCHQAFRAR